MIGPHARSVVGPHAEMLYGMAPCQECCMVGTHATRVVW